MGGSLRMLSRLPSSAAALGTDALVSGKKIDLYYFALGPSFHSIFALTITMKNVVRLYIYICINFTTEFADFDVCIACSYSMLVSACSTSFMSNFK